jgi:hypothetical protein
MDIHAAMFLLLCVPSRCVSDLEWSNQSTLQHYLHTLLLTAPFNTTKQQQQQQQQDAAELRRLLQLLRPLVSSSSKRLGGSEVQLLAQVFFHPQLFETRYVGMGGKGADVKP